jgi:RNA polymerase sigma-70 factor (ECF subfamily)
MRAKTHETPKNDEINCFTNASLGEVTDNLPESAVLTNEAGVNGEDFAALHTAKFNHMVGQLCRRGHNREDALDLVQDSFLNAWRKRDQLRDKACLSGWVMVAAFRRGHGHAKRHRRIIQLPEGFEPAMGCGIDERAIDVRRALATLPDAQKRLLKMSLRGMSGKQIADTLHTTASAVHSQASRARDALRQKIGCDHRKPAQSEVPRHHGRKQKSGRRP